MLVFVNGCFDLLHLGHIKLLEFAYEYGNVFVGLNSDLSIKLNKGNNIVAAIDSYVQSCLEPAMHTFRYTL